MKKQSENAFEFADGVGILIDDVVFKDDGRDVSLVNEGTFHSLEVQAFAVQFESGQFLQGELSQYSSLAYVVLGAAFVHAVL